MGLETVEILMDLEDFFQLKIPDSLASPCVTVADLQAVIVRLLVERGARDDEETWRRVWAGIITVLWGEGYDVAKIRPDSIWIGDITAYGKPGSERGIIRRMMELCTRKHEIADISKGLITYRIFAGEDYTAIPKPCSRGRVPRRTWGFCTGDLV